MLYAVTDRVLKKEEQNKRIAVQVVDELGDEEASNMRKMFLTILIAISIVGCSLQGNRSQGKDVMKNLINLPA